MVQHDAVKIGGRIDSTKARVEHLVSEISNIKTKIDRYYELEQKIESNNKINDEILKLTTEMTKLNLKSIELDKKYKDILYQVISIKE